MNYLLWQNKKALTANQAYYKGPSTQIFGSALDSSDRSDIYALVDYTALKYGNNITANAEAIQEKLFDGDWDVIIFDPTLMTLGGFLSQVMIATGFFYVYLGMYGPYKWLYCFYKVDDTNGNLREE